MEILRLIYFKYFVTFPTIGTDLGFYIALIIWVFIWSLLNYIFISFVTSGELCGTDELLEELLRHLGARALLHLLLEPVAQYALLLNQK